MKGENRTWEEKEEIETRRKPEMLIVKLEVEERRL